MGKRRGRSAGSALLNLRQFLELLRQEGELVEINAAVSSNLEVAEIHRRVIAANGPALLFQHVDQGNFPVVTNLFGSKRRIELAFGNEPEALIADLVTLLTKEFPPKPSILWNKRRSLGALLRLGSRRVRRAPVTQCSHEPDLDALPLLKSWPLDGGAFVTLPLVYTEPIEQGAPNLGMYRLHRYNYNQTGLHWQIAKGGGFHFHQAEQAGQPLPVTIFLGGPPALTLSAIAPLPENVPELLLASLLQEQKFDCVQVPETPHPLLGACEFALVGEARPNERRMEGPFGDHYGYYSWAHEFPVFHCQRIYHRKNAIYPATVVGKPRQEDYYLGNYLQKLLSPLFPVVMPGVKGIWSYGETGFHSLSAAIVQERYYRECMASAFRILGEGQLSLTKFLLVTDQPVDLEGFPTVLTTILERFRPETDLYVFSNLSLDTLDYTGPELNKGSRGVMLGMGDPIRKLPTSFEGELPSFLDRAKPFCPGCLVIEGPPYTTNDPLDALLQSKALQKWPLIVLVDDVEQATQSVAAFLWTTFTRFEPAADLHAASSTVHRHHVCYSGSILIDARMKPSYPPMVSCDEETSQLVTRNWSRYFPTGVEMGDSESASLG